METKVVVVVVAEREEVKQRRRIVFYTIIRLGFDRGLEREDGRVIDTRGSGALMSCSGMKDQSETPFIYY